MAAVPAGAGASALPAGVPDIYDPAIRAHFERMAVLNLQDNPDFPAVLFVNTTEDEPRFLFVGFDARNGKNTWSLSEDPVIFIAEYAAGATLQSMYMDVGFVDQGKASGTFAALDPANGATLRELLNAVASGAERPA